MYITKKVLAALLYCGITVSLYGMEEDKHKDQIEIELFTDITKENSSEEKTTHGGLEGTISDDEGSTISQSKDKESNDDVRQSSLDDDDYTKESNLEEKVSDGGENFEEIHKHNLSFSPHMTNPTLNFVYNQRDRDIPLEERKEEAKNVGKMQAIMEAEQHKALEKELNKDDQLKEAITNHHIHSAKNKALSQAAHDKKREQLIASDPEYAEAMKQEYIRTFKVKMQAELEQAKERERLFTENPEYAEAMKQELIRAGQSKIAMSVAATKEQLKALGDPHYVGAKIATGAFEGAVSGISQGIGNVSAKTIIKVSDPIIEKSINKLEQAWNYFTTPTNIHTIEIALEERKKALHEAEPLIGALTPSIQIYQEQKKITKGFLLLQQIYPKIQKLQDEILDLENKLLELKYPEFFKETKQEQTLFSLTNSIIDDQPSENDESSNISDIPEKLSVIN